MQTLIAALLLGTASGCATVDMEPSYAPLTNARPAARPVTVVLVQRGDTVAGVARRYGLSSQAIIEANALRAPYQLTQGQRLVLPPSAVHIVSPGETVSSISRAYGVSRQAIVDANDLNAPDVLQPGQRIAIPFVGPRPRSVAQAASPKTVEGVDPRVAGARYYALGRPRAKPELDGQGGPEMFEPPTADETVRDPIAPKKDIEPGDGERATGKFIWPVDGKVISRFGRRNTGVHNDGINIAADPGSPVKAADAGVVVYGGNELTAYGNLLLIRHSSGYVTAYAHNRRLLVKRGDAVKQGQTIALVGSTGDVDRPQLHFEIRKGDRAVDPNRYLSRATASR
ncbi:MAG: LysM peptidoglycan-binding domain-containing M23 family metallopeptidase [Alphaproteobacteria bacterium]|nr:LysM peptidoglycan-binding domain-containing M23 family metallopeptidase [Alphaproteobacteria bacterium]